MKNILLLTLFIGLFGYISAQTQRMVLIEEYTNASCIPCAQQNPAFNALLDQNTDKVISIKFQTSFPGFDPFYYNQDIPAELRDVVDSRFSMYGLSGVPSATIDGVVPSNDYGGGGLSTWTDQAGNGYNGGPYGYNQAVIDHAYSQESAFELNVDYSVDGDRTTGYNMNAVVTIINATMDSITLDGHTFHLMMVEEESVFPEPPGNTNEAEFFDIFRGHFSTPQSLSGVMAPGDTLPLDYTRMMPSYIYNKAEIGLVSFIQNTSTLEVMQAAKADALPFSDPDASLAEISVDVDESNCIYDVQASAIIENTGDTTINSVQLGLVNDADIVDLALFEGELDPGEVATVIFENFTELELGSYNLRAIIASVNGGSDLNSLNNVSQEVIETQKWSQDVVFVDSIQFDFEAISMKESPANSYIADAGDFLGVVSVNGLRTYFGQPNFVGRTGGFGRSEFSFMSDFFRWNPNAANPTSQWAIDKLSLLNRQNTRMTFDLAHAQYPNASDGVNIYVSTDCGVTREQVYSKSGADLATAASTEGFYIPNSSGEWRTEPIDLSAFDNFGEVNIIFEFVTDHGNNVYIDNVNVVSEMPVANEELASASGWKIFPNPASDIANLEFELDEQHHLDIEILDYTGRVVTPIARSASFNSGNHSIALNVSDLNTGTYFVRVRSDEKSHLEVLNISK